MTLAIGHRGVAHIRPENTLASFEEALRLGAEMIELDVQRTRDSKIVIIHDDSVDRTSNGRGPVRSLTLDELKGLDFGGWFDARYVDQQIPTLAEVIDLVRGKAQLNIELKTASALGDAGFESQLIRELEEARFLDDAILSCFDHYALRAVRRESARVRTGILYAAGTGMAVEMARWADAQALHPFFPFVNSELVQAAHAAGLTVNTWTVDQPAVARQLMAWGVDGIISNSAEVLQQIKESGSPN